ncbi:flavocytochrome c [Fusibacter sp. JL298sf-3]
MKKHLCLLMTMMLVVGLFAGCGAKEDEASKAIYTAGTYEGKGQGHSGTMVVNVTVTETEIESIEIVEFSDSEFAVDPADQLVKKIIEANSGDVDGVAGASQTSKGILEAVNDALSKALIDGAASTETPVDEPSEEPGETTLEDIDTDVVVIGAGGAGLTAAIEAKNGGAEVVVIEKMPLIGGNTKYATGGLNAAETAVQKEKGIEDSIDLFISDTMKGGGDLNNPELVDVLANNSAETVEWLVSIGADLSDVGRMGGASADRTHRPTGGAAVGNHLVEVLNAKASEMGIEVLLGHEAIELIGDESAVTGVKVKTEAGEFTINAKAVIVATGGFGADNDRVASFKEDLKGYGTTNHPGATGDVVDFAKNLNVSYVDMEQIQTHPTVMPSNNYMITEAVRGNGAILVNREGQRFVNELETRANVSNAELAQTGASAFLVFDQSVRESLKAIEKYHSKGFLLEAETPEALAELISVDPAALKATIDTYNGYVEAGEDADFARQDLKTTLAVGPYYAVEVAPAVHHTMGGLEITTDAEVLNASGEVIKGLYAAGEVTGGIHGNNRLGGNALSDITTFGRIAGTKAAEAAK